MSIQIHQFGLGEADAAERLGEMTASGRRPRVTITTAESIVTASVDGEGDPQPLEADARRIEQLWRPYAFGRDGAGLAEAAGALLRNKHKRLVTAESCTGGWLGKVIVDVPGSSDCYIGGIIAYSNALKKALLAVPNELLAARGAVSEDVAAAMAAGALALADADAALSITGIAGPDGGAAEKPLGTVFIGLASQKDALIETSVRRFAFPGDRTAVRDRSVKAALQMLRFDLLDVDPSVPLLWEVRHKPQNANNSRRGMIAGGSPGQEDRTT